MLEGDRLGAPRLDGRFARIFHGISIKTETVRSRKMRFAVAKQQNPALRDSESFFSRFRRVAKR